MIYRAGYLITTLYNMIQNMIKAELHQLVQINKSQFSTYVIDELAVIVRQPKNHQSDKPRMIHVAFRSFRLKEKVCKACLDKLKTTRYKQAKLFVTDDLSKSIQERHQKDGSI